MSYTHPMPSTVIVPPQAWGELIRTQRENMKMTQRQLADAVGVTTTTISRIERGIELPRFTLMIKLAKALRQELAALFPYPKIDWSAP